MPEIAKTDLALKPQSDESEIFFNYTSGNHPVSVYINGILRAQCFSPGYYPYSYSDITDTREKVIVKNGSLTIVFVIKEVADGRKKDEWYWKELRRESLNIDAHSNSITIDIAVSGSNQFTTLAVSSTRPLTPSQIAIVPQKINDNIEEAVESAGGLLIETLPENSIIAIISMGSDDIEMSAFVVEELEFIFVNTRFRNYRVVDRKSLDKIRAEQNFQMSGEVDDVSAISIGKLLGAKIVVTGNLSGTGSIRRLRVKALDVLTGEIVAMASERF
jgi:hypothetical protein